MDKDDKSQLSPEMLSERIKAILEKIKTDSDTNPAELEEIKKIIRKNVPFFMRGAFSAFVLRELMNCRTQGPRKDRRERRESQAVAEKRKDQNRTTFPQKEHAVQMKAADAAEDARAEVETNDDTTSRQSAQDDLAAKAEKEERVIPEGAKTLYLNVGKMKRLYAKNLSQLLQSELGITREDIYSLRVHDKYSFITMSEENCEKAIEKLNGKDINGRTAMLNYSNR